MFIFKRKSAQVLNDLEAYLTLNGGEPLRLLEREVKSWGEVSYEEICAAIEEGRLDDLLDWQGRYSKVVNEIMTPAWLKAIEVASKKASRGKKILSDSEWQVRQWIETHGAQLVTQLSDESKKAIANILLKWQAELLDPKRMAQQIRPLIGLNTRQIQANASYREKVFNRLSEKLPPSKAAVRADIAALKYASKQHRYRAETIVHTELAFAYNQAAHRGALSLGRCEMIWSTAGTHRVCGRCLALKDTVVGYTDEQGVELPPLHPRCRCCIVYREAKSEVGSTRRNRPLTEKESLTAKADEEKAYRTRTGADFGFKKMRGEPDWLKGLLSANATEIYTPNCQRCVVAFEARMRGYDVVARPSWGKDDTLRTQGTWIEAFEHSYGDFKNCIGKTGEAVIKSVEEIMRSFGEGSRAIILFKWDKNKILDSAEGHALVAQCFERGKVNIGDPQTGERATAWKLKLADLKEGVILLRTDNLKFTDTVKRCCKNRSG